MNFAPATAHLGASRLINLYCHLIDGGTAQAIARLFTPDAVLTLRFARDKALRGRPAIEEWFANYMATTRARSAYNRHWVARLDFQPDGESLRARAFVDAAGTPRETGEIRLLRGRYEDSIVQRNNVWLFGGREIFLWDERSAPVELHGSIPIPAPHFQP